MFPQPKYGKGLGNHAENVTRINAGLDRGAHVCPVVTKVEHIDELLRGLTLPRWRRYLRTRHQSPDRFWHIGGDLAPKDESPDRSHRTFDRRSESYAASRLVPCRDPVLKAQDSTRNPRFIYKVGAGIEVPHYEVSPTSVCLRRSPSGSVAQRPVEVSRRQPGVPRRPAIRVS